jgi:hypothetical protein
MVVYNQLRGPQLSVGGGRGDWRQDRQPPSSALYWRGCSCQCVQDSIVNPPFCHSEDGGGGGGGSSRYITRERVYSINIHFCLPVDLRWRPQLL